MIDSSKHVEAGYEKKDADAKMVARAALVGGIAILFVAGAAGLAWHALIHSAQLAGAGITPIPMTLPPEPRLETNPAQSLKNLRQKEDLFLNHYAWVDASKKTVRIPIERAMDLIAQRGLPARKAKKEKS